MSDPSISVLVPVYNVEKYLDECLASLAEQTLTDFEAICINDGSTDGSRAIIERYCAKDGRFRVIDKPNSGYGASMNVGMDAARGKYLGILESDDFFEKDALRRLLEAAEANDAQVVKADFWLFWSEPTRLNKVFNLFSEDMAGRVIDPQVEHSIFYLKPSIWSSIYRRDFLLENGIRFLETPGASYQDAGFNFKVWASASRVFFLTDPVLHYRQDNEASSVNSPGKVYCVCDEYAEMRRYLESRLDRGYLKPVLERMKFDTYMWNYDRLSSDLQSEFILRFSSEFREDAEEGLIDVSLFDPWKQEELDLIICNPLLFHAGRSTSDGEGLISKALRYYRTGGARLLFEAFFRKLGFCLEMKCL